MTRSQPRRWTTSLPLAEWWYNTNYYTTIEMTLYQALYGIPPTYCGFDRTDSPNEVVVELLKDHYTAINFLRDKLTKAQERMKFYADKGRTERKFEVGDQVYLKLQSYRHTLVAKRPNQQLSPKYFGLYQILQKVGIVAYKIILPKGSNVHPSFHMSQLKRRVGPKVIVASILLVVDYKGNPEIKPDAILEKKAIKKGNQASIQVLVKWTNLDPSNATWEDLATLQ